MKLLFDQSLSPSLVDRLPEGFTGSRHVRDLQLAEASDRAVWDFAAEHDFAIVSKGGEFGHLARLRGFPPKVVRLRAMGRSVGWIEATLLGATERLLAFDRDPESSLMSLPVAAPEPAAITPELYVSDLDASLRFWVDRVGFEIDYARPEEHFACLRLGEARLLLERPASFEIAEPEALEGGRWIVAPLERPFGRGMNLQIVVPDVAAVADRLSDAQDAVVLPIHERVYDVRGETETHRVLLLSDPDGYLARLVEVVACGA